MPIFTFLSRFHGGARSQYLDMRHRLHYVSPMKKPPKMLCWFLMSESLRGRKYREEIDFIKAHTGVDMLLVMPETGVITEDYDQCHSLMADLVGYAHSKGIGITLYVSLGHGFFNGGMDPNVSDAVGHLEMFTIKRPEDAQGLAVCGETIADADGCAAYTHEAKWARSKIRPLRAKLLRVFAFDKAGDGFYAPGSLADVTDRARIVECRTHSLSLEIDAGREHAGKTIFVVVVQYYNWPELFGESEWAERKALMDVYAGIPLDGVAMDEYGYMLLNASGIGNGSQPPFRGHFYSLPQKQHVAERFGLDLDRMMLDLILTGERTPFDFIVDGIRYHGESTGIVACRKDRKPILSKGGTVRFEKADRQVGDLEK